jgi:tetratricopeptide (TPR) repeat protein
VHSAEENFDAALPIYRKARDIYEALSKNLPEFGRRYQGNLVEVYGKISWCTLFTRQPEEAIQAAARGIELDPNQHWIKTNLAHGYLFTNQFEKAKAIYTQNKKLDLGDGKTFATSVLDDFREFRESGLMHPRMVEIERLLSAKP